MAKYISIHTGNKIDEAVGKVDGIESNVSTLSQDVTTLEGAVDQLDSDVNTLESDVSTISQDLVTLDNTVANHINDSDIHLSIEEIKSGIGIDPVNGSSVNFLNEIGNFTPIPLSGNGNSANVYLTTQDSEETNYKLLSYSLEATETNISRTFDNSTLLVQKYLFPAGVATNTLPAGTYEFDFWASSNKNNTSIVVEFFKRSISDVDTVLFTVESTQPITSSISNIKIISNQIAYTVLPTDRIGINVYFKSIFTNTTMVYIVGDGRSAYWKGTAQPRHSDLRDKNGEVAYQHIDNSVEFSGSIDETYDKLSIWDNSVTKWIKFSFSNLKTYLKTYFDTIYQGVLGFTPENSSNKKTTLTDDSDTYYPTQKAVNTGLATKQNINLYFADVSASTWVSDTTYSGYGYKCVLSTGGVTSNMTAFVTFGHTESISGKYSPVCLTNTDSVTIYSKVNTSITIPRITVLK